MEAPYRPVALRVMAEWGEQDPAWDSDLDHMGSVELTELGVSAELIEQLRAWNEQFNALGWSDYRWPDDEQERAWQDEGLRLAYQLQNELPEVEVSYVHDGDDQPLRRRRGP